MPKQGADSPAGVFRSNKITLFSPHSPNECASRLTAAMDPETVFSWSSMFGSKPVIGEVRGNSLELRKRIIYRNSFQPSLSATIEPVPGGTVISGVMRMHPFVVIFMCAWLGIVFCVGGATFLSAVGEVLNGNAPNRVGVLVPSGMFVFGIVLLWFGRFLGRNEAGFIKRFLIQTLDGREL
jgi:hypothetical protein